MKVPNCFIYVLFFTVFVGCSKVDKCLQSQMLLWETIPIKPYKKCANPEIVYKEKFIPGYKKVYPFHGCGNEVYYPLLEFKLDALEKCMNN